MTLAVSDVTDTEPLRDVADLRSADPDRGGADLMRFFEKAADPMCVVGFDGRFKWLNWAWQRVLGFSLEALEGQPVLGLIHPDDRPAFERSAAAARLTSNPVQLAVRFLSQGGAYERLSWRATADLEEGCLYATARVAAAPGEREAVARAASRDLQRPARQVSSYLQLLARHGEGELDPEMEGFIGMAVDAAKQMQRLIHDLPAASQADEEAPQTSVSMEAALARALRATRRALRKAGAAVTHDPLPDVAGDPAQLAELLQHLIANAVRFRRAGVPLRVHVGARRRGSQWHLSVEDNGSGMAPAHRERLFAALQQPRAWGEESMGAGLMRCKRIVERHRGRIWVESRMREGSVFHFTLQAV